MDFTISSAIADKYLHVESTSVSADKTQFNIKVTTLSPEPGATATEYSLLRMSYIIIGSDFPGQPSNVESSYAYAKNSGLVLVDSSKQVGIFNFANGGTSPFDYSPNSNLGSGCGSVFKDGKIIIETGGCQYYRFFVYITGFHYESNNAADLDLDIGAVLTRNENVPAQDYEDLMSGNPDSIFKETSTSTDYGLRITYSAQSVSNSIVKSLQPSFVFVGIRSWTLASYPVQLVTMSDSFVHYGGSSTRTVNSNLLLATPDSVIYTKVFNNIAHAFCGLSKFEDDTTAGAPSLQSVYGTTSTTLTNTPTANSATFSFFTCALFGSKTLCDPDPKIAVLSSGTDRITIEDNMGTNGSGDKRVEAVTTVAGTNIVATRFNPTIKFRLDLQAEDNTATITLKFDKEGRSAFEGIVAFHENAPVNAFNAGDSIKVVAFGKTVIDETITAALLTTYDNGRRFEVHSSDPSQT